MKYLLAKLTPRELDVLSRMAMGESNPNIANKLFIEVKTVEHHINNIYSRFGLITNQSINRRVQAVLIFIQCTEMKRIKLITEKIINEYVSQKTGEGT
jgi:DNA-binding NarL/FixJ family response regulator